MGLKMTNEIQNVPMPEYYIPSQSPREKIIGNKISKLYKGSSVWIIPLSARYGDDVTAMAINCLSFSTSLIELPEPFQAYIEEYDGQFIKVRNSNYYCLKIDIGDLKDLIPCAGAEKSQQEDFT